MAEVLGGIHGKFILSLNDRPEMRETFKAIRIEGVETTYSVGGGKRQKRAGEVLIRNY